MKKLIYLIIILLMPTVVSAKESTKNREYRYYYLEKEYSNVFYEKGKNDSLYPKISTNWYYSDEVKTSIKKPNKESLIVKEIPVVKYQENQKVRYIIIDQLFSESKINLTEIEVFTENQKINYKVQCDTCADGFFGKIQNTLVHSEYNYISNNQKIIVDLQEEYFPDDLTIKLHFMGAMTNTIKYRVTVNNTKKIDDQYYQYKIETPLSVYLETGKKLKEVEHIERFEEEVKIAKGLENIENAKIIEKTTEYHYRNKVYQYYKEVKHYLDGYYSNLPNLIKDENDFIEKEIENKEESDKIIEYVEKEKIVPKTITEYIEKQIPIKRYIEVPIIKEKTQYKDNFVEVEVPVEKIVEKIIPTKKQSNYPFQYLIYFTSAVFLKKMSFFKG